MITIGLMTFCFLLLISIFLGLVIGPINFFGYLIYGGGWLIAGHGVPVFMGWKVNASYAYAIYPLASWFHRAFWKVYISFVDYLPGVKALQINNIASRAITFFWFGLLFTGLWYLMGTGLMWAAEEYSEMNPVYYIELGHFIHDNPWIFQIFFTCMVVASYILVIWKWRVAMKHEDMVESWIK